MIRIISALFVAILVSNASAQTFQAFLPNCQSIDVNPGVLNKGVVVLGHISPRVVGWAIDFEGEGKNIPVHFNTRYNENTIVINNQVNDRYDYSKEVRVPIPQSLRNGRNYSLRFAFNGNKVAVTDQELGTNIATFELRDPIANIRRVRVCSESGAAHAVYFL